MKRFLLRELRRQLPIACALLGLGVLVALFILSASLFQQGMELHVDAAVMAVAIGAPWVLGATVLAPDVETGAEAFLTTLPVSRWKMLAVRVGVAFSFSVLTLAAFRGLLAGLKLGLDLKNPFAFPLGEVLVALFLFPAGLLASVVARRTLPAFLLTPVFLFAPALVYLGVLVEFGAPASLIDHWGVRAMLPTVLTLAAILAYAGANGEQSARRPLLHGGAVIGAALVLATVGTTAGYAYQRYTSPWRVDYVTLTSPDGRRVGVVLTQQTEWGNESERPTRQVIVDADRLHDPWELPATTRPFCFSPDGALLLATSDDGLWELWDCKRRTLIKRTARTALPGPGPVSKGRPGVLRTRGVRSRYGKDVVWRGGMPYFVTSHPFLIAWDGSPRLQLPDRLEAVEDVAGTRLLLRLKGGARAVCQLEYRADPSKVCMELPSLGDGVTVHEAALGPRGRWLFVLGKKADGTFGLWTSEAGGNPLVARRLPIDLEKDVVGLRASVSPGGKHALVDARFRRGSSLELVSSYRVDLDAGRATRNDLGALDVLAWSSSGRFVVSPERTWDLASPRAVGPVHSFYLATRGAVFLNAHSLLRFNEAFVKGHAVRGRADVVDLRSGQAVPFDPLGSTTTAP